MVSTARKGDNSVNSTNEEQVGYYDALDLAHATMSYEPHRKSGMTEVEETEFIDVRTLRVTLPPGTHEATVTYSARLRQGPVPCDGPVESVHLAPQPPVELERTDITTQAH